MVARRDLRVAIVTVEGAALLGLKGESADHAVNQGRQMRAEVDEQNTTDQGETAQR